MRRLNTRTFAAGAAALLLAALLAACRVGETPTAAYPGPLVRTPVRPTAHPTVIVTPRPAQATAVPATAPMPAPTRQDIAFTLSIVYSGEVQGEVLPCG